METNLAHDTGGALAMEVSLETWPMKSPFRITGFTFHEIPLVVVTLRQGGFTARGEACGVFYLDDTPEGIVAQLEELRPDIEAGLTREALQARVPAGGARNALDCAMWELESRKSGTPVWKLAGLEEPKPLLTTFTLGADEPDVMGKRAAEIPYARALKLKLTGDGADAARVSAVRKARPDVWLGVDGNQGFDRASLEKLIPHMVGNDVALVEQPCRRGDEESLAGLDAPMPLAADESALTLADIAPLKSLFDVINIKLDKCGGLTEGLAMAREARRLGLDVMVGNMMGTSWSAAPSFLVGQLCDVVDLDGPWLLAADRDPGVVYQNGYVECPPGVWGGPPSQTPTPGTAP